LNEGGTIGIYNYTRAFHELGHEVTLLCLAPDKHAVPMNELEENLGAYCDLITHPIDTSVKPLDALLNLFSNKSYNVERFNNAAFRKALVSHLSENEYDVIQLEGTFVGPYINTVRQHSKAVVALRQHNVEYQIWERLARNSKNPLKRGYLKLLAKRLKAYESRIFHEIDAIVPVTEDDLTIFRKFAPNVPSFVSPAGIDTDTWFRVDKDPMHHLYHIGSMEWMPNREAVDWFITDIWHLMREAIPNIEFHVAGKNMPEFYETLGKNGLHFHGEVANAHDFISDKGICLVPLRSGSGIRLKILEAMASGKVVVSTTVGAQGIDCEDGKHLLIADTPQQMVNAVNDLLKNPSRAQQLADNAYQLIQDQYSNKAVVGRLVNFYERLAAR
jgi:glycosyltransferase involved in cell wall biosynthesis